MMDQRTLMRDVLEDIRLVRLQRDGGAILARLRKESDLKYPHCEDLRYTSKILLSHCRFVKKILRFCCDLIQCSAFTRLRLLIESVNHNFLNQNAAASHMNLHRRCGVNNTYNKRGAASHLFIFCKTSHFSYNFSFIR